MIITNKQFPNYKKYEIMYEGRPLSMEVGKLAELCNAAVLVKYGETTVLVTCTASARPKDGIDYFPLAVDFNEKLYAVGRIPGSFMRREGKPSLPAVLASRLIDRPMRPLFPSDLRNDVVIACEVLSVDRDCSPEITAMIGASAAVSISDVPFNGPIAGIVLGWDGEKFLFNPTAAEKETNRMTTTIAATHKKIVMIESEADQVPDDVMYEGIVQAHEHLQPVLDLIDRMVAEIGKPKFEYEHAAFDQALFDELTEKEFESMEFCMDTDDKNVREARVNDWVSMVEEKYGEEHPDMMQYMDEILYKLQKKVVKKWLLAGKRVDGRQMDEIRPLGAEVGVIPLVHGSGLFTRGQTQVLSIATLAPLSECQKLDTIWEETEKRFMHHYNMPPYSTGEARPSRSTGRREYGHGALVEKALECVIPEIEDFPYAIRVVSEVLSSNGSTSQGSVCGTTLALMDAGVPIKAPVAGISCGLIQDGDDFTTFIDIQGVEDFHGEMDFKVAGTKQGITAIQMDLKNDGLKHEIVKEAFAMTKEARFQILDDGLAGLHRRHARVLAAVDHARLADGRLAAGKERVVFRLLLRAGHAAVVGEHADDGQVVALADLKVVRVVRRGDLHHAGALFHIGVLVADDRDFDVHQRQDDVAAVQMRIARVVFVDGHGGIAQHRLRAGRRQFKLLARLLDGVEQVPEVTLLLLILHLRVGNGGLAAGTPVDYALAPVNESFIIKIDKNLFDSL